MRFLSYLRVGHGTSPEDASSTLGHVVVDAFVLPVEVAWTQDRNAIMKELDNHHNQTSFRSAQQHVMIWA